jgi:glycosyltransferase involved in cell wall biosynthesis
VAYRGAGGVNESILDGQTGVLVASLDQGIDAVRDLLRSPDRLEAMATAGRQRAGTFSWESSALALEALLGDVAREGQFVP